MPKIKLSKLLYIRVTIPYPLFVRMASINQTRRPDFSKYTRLPVTCWVKLSLNFELLVNRVMKFSLGQRLFINNMFLYNLNYSHTNYRLVFTPNLKVLEMKVNRIENYEGTGARCCN